MIFEQAAILILLIAMLAVFALDRVRMEVVALAGLGIAFALGLVPASDLFSGFADPAVVTVVEILLIVQVLAHGALLDRLAGPIVSAKLGERATIAMLCVISAAISVFMNNVGALALMIPVVYGVCRAVGIAPGRALMPVSFATLLGGICSVIGTPANLIASSQLAAATGHSFALFDFAWAGIPTAIAGLVAITLFIPQRFAEASGSRIGSTATPRRVVAPARLPDGSPLVGMSIADLPFTLHSALRGERHLFLGARGTTLQSGDLLLAEMEEDRLATMLARGELADAAGEGLAGFPSTQAVVMPQSTVVGSRVGNLHAFGSRNVRVKAVSPRTTRIEGAFEDLQLSIGDVLYLDGPENRIAEVLAETEMLAVSAAEPRRAKAASWFGLAVFGAGILAAATSIVPPEIAFGAVVFVLAATGTLDLRAGIGALNWPIIIMLAAMIPMGTAVETTGAATVLADALVAVAPAGEPVLLSAAMLLLAVVITPFVNNASTVIVLGPVAVDAAHAAAIPPEPLLVAVAMGASIDFLTPFGHHNNTLVMGLGAYRFADFPRAGWPVVLAACATGLLFIALIWQT